MMVPGLANSYNLRVKSCGSVYFIISTIMLLVVSGMPSISEFESERSRWKRNRSSLELEYLSPRDFENALQMPTKVPTSDDLQAMELPHLFEGDIMGMAESHNEESPTEPADVFKFAYAKNQFRSVQQHSALNTLTFPDKLWRQNRVPYVLQASLSDSERSAVAQAFEEYRVKTCIHFAPREPHEADFVFIKKNYDSGCSSYVGRAGGNQTVSLEVEKCFSKGIIAHELMHVLGYFHEHSRVDRDDYIYVMEENVARGMMRNFEKYTPKIMDTLDMPYDYGSVMHYHKLAFSKNGKSTIVPFDRTAEIGQRLQLSEIDAAKINKLYKCNDFGSKSTTSTTVPTSATKIWSTTRKSTSKNPFVQTSTSVASTKSSTVEKVFTVDRTSTLVPAITTSISHRKSASSTFPATTASTTTVPVVRHSKPCRDQNDHCEMWASIGHCKWSFKYMNNYCQKSCNLCEENIRYTTRKRPVSSTSIPEQDCSDKNLFCTYWAKIGECENESEFMNSFCKKACHLC